AGSRFDADSHEKLSCRVCDTVVAAPAPDHAIARRRAGAGLLATASSLPLFRSRRIAATGTNSGGPLPEEVPSAFLIAAA
ncbi:MAG: hypothetical protein WBX30_34810, partial [Stellaceae bacterium]